MDGAELGRVRVELDAVVAFAREARQDLNDVREVRGRHMMIVELRLAVGEEGLITHRTPGNWDKGFTLSVACRGARAAR